LTKTTLENGNTLVFFVNNKKRSSFNNFPKGGANASPQEPKIEKDKSMVKCYYCHKKKHFASKCKTQTKDRANVNFQKSYPNILNKPIQAPLKILQYQKFICVVFTKMEIVKSKILGSLTHELVTIRPLTLIHLQNMLHHPTKNLFSWVMILLNKQLTKA
jgi:hypothetical protein